MDRDSCEEAQAMATVYREYDIPGIKRAYNVPASIPEPLLASYLSSYAEESQRLRAVLPAQLDIAYGNQPAQKLDIFVTERPNAPILVYFHGGGWRNGNKNARAFPAQAFAQAGAIWVPAGYTLCPVATVEEMVAEARAAVAWVYRNAPSFGGDKQRIFVAGNSAGAHLAAMVMGTAWRDYDLPADLVKGACLSSGVYDFEPLTFERFKDPAHLFRDPVKQREVGSYRHLSPMEHPPAAPCDVVVAVGDSEPYEFRRQSIDYYDMLRKRRLRSKLLIATEHNHFSIVGEWARPNSPLQNAAFALLGCR